MVLEHYDGEYPVNVGSGVEITIADLAAEVARATGFTGRIIWDDSMPDGTPRKLLDSTEIRALGWAPKIGLIEGIERTVAEYRDMKERTR